tara:strand:+ start:4764 stop:5234 length:471 start_codon:yes stop_codon:yes gene_type:complete
MDPFFLSIDDVVEKFRTSHELVNEKVSYQDDVLHYSGAIRCFGTTNYAEHEKRLQQTAESLRLGIDLPGEDEYRISAGEPMLNKIIPGPNSVYITVDYEHTTGSLKVNIFEVAAGQEGQDLLIKLNKILGQPRIDRPDTHPTEFNYGPRIRLDLGI